MFEAVSQASSIHAGVYILSISTKLLAQTNNPDVIESMSQILYDLVNGEFQQMTSRSVLNIYSTTYKHLDKQLNIIPERTKMTDSSCIWTKPSTRRPA